jgi:GTPase
VVALNKVDVSGGIEIAGPVREELEGRGCEVFLISAVTGEGVQRLIYRLGERLSQMQPVEPPAEDAPVLMKYTRERTWEVGRDPDGAHAVRGPGVERMVAMTDLNSEDSVRWLHRRLDKMGVLEALRNSGAKQGDTVRIAGAEFDFVEEA